MWIVTIYIDGEWRTLYATLDRDKAEYLRSILDWLQIQNRGYVGGKPEDLEDQK